MREIRYRENRRKLFPSRKACVRMIPSHTSALLAGQLSWRHSAVAKTNVTVRTAPSSSFGWVDDVLPNFCQSVTLNILCTILISCPLSITHASILMQINEKITRKRQLGGLGAVPKLLKSARTLEIRKSVFSRLHSSNEIFSSLFFSQARNGKYLEFGSCNMGFCSAESVNTPEAPRRVNRSLAAYVAHT